MLLQIKKDGSRMHSLFMAYFFSFTNMFIMDKHSKVRSSEHRGILPLNLEKLNLQKRVQL